MIVSVFGDSCLHAVLFHEFPVTWEVRGIVCSCLWVTWTSSSSPPGIFCQQQFLGSFSGLSKLLLAPLEAQNAALYLNADAEMQFYVPWIFIEVMF